MSYDIVLFDLDGTLVRSDEGITRGVQRALAQFGIHEEPEKLTCFVGPPMHVSFEKNFGIRGEDYKKAMDVFHDYYRSVGIFEAACYEGIPRLLDVLSGPGKRLFVATSKPEPEARRVLKHFELDTRFAFIGGSDGDFGPQRATKTDVIRYVMKENGLSVNDSIVMVGDRHHDVEGANHVGIPSIGVLYGYGSREELAKAGATHIVESVGELGSLLGGCGKP